MQLVASREYVLPPRLKPGRKPKADGGTHNALGPLQKHPETSPGGQVALERNSHSGSERKDSREAAPGPHSILPKPPLPPQNKGSQSTISTPTDDDSCGLCEKEECVCADLGLRENRPTTSSNPSGTDHHAMAIAVGHTGQPTGVQFDNFVPLKAVPLRRSIASQKNRADGQHASQLYSGPRPLKRFKRLDEHVTQQNKHHDHIVLPQPPSFPQSSMRDADRDRKSLKSPAVAHQRPKDPCGFCSNDTPCLCAGDGPSADGELPSTPKRSNRNHSNLQSPAQLSLSRTPDGCGFCVNESDCICKPAKAPAEVEATRNLPTQGLASLSERRDCSRCKSDAMCALFCVSVGSCAKPLPHTAPTLGCAEAYDVVSRHPKFATADLGGVVQLLEAASNGRVSVRSLANAIRFLDT
jgi:hypothetical protein